MIRRKTPGEKHAATSATTGRRKYGISTGFDAATKERVMQMIRGEAGISTEDRIVCVGRIVKQAISTEERDACVKCLAEASPDKTRPFWEMEREIILCVIQQDILLPYVGGKMDIREIADAAMECRRRMVNA